MLLDLWGSYYEWLRKRPAGGIPLKEPKFVFTDEEKEKRKKRDEVLLFMH